MIAGPLAGAMTPLGRARRKATYRDIVLADGPLGYWRLGDTGASLANEVGGGDAGTFAGAGWTKGATGLLVADDDKAAVSSGAANVGITLPTNALWARTTVTLECWIKCTAPGASYRGLIVKNNHYGMFLFNSLLIAYDMGGAVNRATTVNAADGVAHHCVYTFQSGVTNGSQLWFDGTSRLTFTATTSIELQAMVFGAGANPPTVQNFAGTLDEIAIYGGILTSAQILAHYQAGAA